MCTVKIKT